MNHVRETASNRLDRVARRWRSRMGRRPVEPELVDEPDEEDSSNLALFFWGALTALALWWLYLRPAANERRMTTLRQGQRPDWRPGPLPGSRPAEAAPPAYRTSTAAAEARAPAAGAGEDDLTLIYGIGPARAARLQEVGIATFEALAIADAEQLRDILSGVGVNTADLSTWPEQASLAAKGDWEGLEAYKEKLRADRGQ